jgi:pyruvate dehydrogenase E2 component (dihydrolipoamide acetyltransferase)
MSEIAMPRLAEEMEEGTIVRWLRADGDLIAPGDELVEIETDKATTIYDAEVAGVLTILAGAGATVPVGGAIATVAGPSETEVAPVVEQSPATAAEDATPEAATPEPATPAGAGEPQQPAAETAKGETTVTEPTRAQSQIARRMAESRATVPAYTLRATIDMQACVELRARLAESAPGRRPPTIGDLVVKACANALRRSPRANGAYRDGRFERYKRVNVGVAIDTGEAFVVATVFDADRKRLGEISEETAALAERARAGTITPPELAGATFTVSNLGMFGVRSFEAVVSPSQAAILAVGAVEPRAEARDGAVVVRDVMDVELSCDHRILLGAEAARLLADIRMLLEEPQRMAL